MPNTTPSQVKVWTAVEIADKFTQWKLVPTQFVELADYHEAERRVAAVERERDTHKAEREVHFTEWQLAHDAKIKLTAEYAALAEMVMAWARALEATGYVDHEQDERRLLAELFEVERSLLRWARRRRTFASPAAPEQDTRHIGDEG